MYTFAGGSESTKREAISPAEGRFPGNVAKPYRILPCGIDVISTGSLRVDIALAIGGIPRGQIIEICGPESSGKTSLSMHILAEAQKQREQCAWIELDHTFEPCYAQVCGVDPNLLYFSEPASGEQALAIARILAQSGSMAAVVIDSASSLVREAELDARLGEMSVQQGEDWTAAGLNELETAALWTSTAVIFTNHTWPRHPGYDDPFPLKSERLALKLHTSTCLRLQPIHTIRENGQGIGERVEVRVVKSRFSPCCRTTVLDIMYNEGITKVGDILDLGIQLSLIIRQGSAYHFRDLRLGNGRDETLGFLRQNPQVSQKIEKAIRLSLLPPAPMPVEL